MSNMVHHGVGFCRVVGFICTSVFVLLVVVKFMLAFHEEHTLFRQKLRDDAWLVEKCNDPQFYINFKQHSDLCQDVQANAQTHVFLHCFKGALQAVELCGFVSCQELAYNLMNAIANGGILAMGSFVALSLILPILCMHLFRIFCDAVAEQHLKTKYNMPFGYNAALVGGGESTHHGFRHDRKRIALEYADLGDPSRVHTAFEP